MRRRARASGCPRPIHSFDNLLSRISEGDMPSRRDALRQHRRTTDRHGVAYGAGVYVIRCLATGKVYVGSSSNVAGRYVTHLSKLRRGTHPNAGLQQDFVRYGPDSFVCDILERVTNLATLKAREQIYLDRLRASEPAYGYNIASDARAMHRGTQLSATHRVRISLARTGKGMRTTPVAIVALRNATQLPPRARGRAKTYVLTAPDGREYRVENLYRFALAMGLNWRGLGRVARGEKRSWKGWQARFIHDHEERSR
jgi:GIY-YIG catalytic domain